MRIIIVEDEIKTREGLAKLIESQTAHVVQGKAANGKDGLEMVLRFKPDLVITDIRMPGMDGLEMVRSLFEQKVRFHAVILSGYSEFEYARKAIHYGVDDYLLKPLDVDDIKKMLDKVEEKLQKEQTANAVVSLYLKNLIAGEEQEADENCRILKELCGLSDVGDYELFAGYIGSAQPSYRENMEQFARGLQERYPQLKIYYIYLENRQEGYLLGCGEPGGERLQDLETAAYYGLILKQHSKEERAVWTKKRFSSLGQVREAAKELHSLLAYALVLKPQGWLDAAAADQYCPKPYAAPVHIYNQMRSAVCQDDAKGLAQSTDALLAYLSDGHFESEEIRKACVKAYYLIADTVQELDSGRYEHMKSKNLLRNIEAAVTWRELEGALKDAVQAAAGTQEKREDISNYVIKRAINYIREHYQEGLSQEQVATVLDITPEYLSILFSREVGINFSVFLKRFRISHAKRLLKGTDLKVYEIAGAVGYSDPKYFQRVFKEEIGVSPGEYRQMK